MQKRHADAEVALVIDFESPKEELQVGDLVLVYADVDAEGHKYHKGLGVVLGTVRKPTSFMQFFTYRVFVNNTIAKIHEVWIEKLN